MASKDYDIFFCQIVNDLLHKGTVEVHWNFKEYHQIIKHSMIIICMLGIPKNTIKIQRVYCIIKRFSIYFKKTYCASTSLELLY